MTLAALNSRIAELEAELKQLRRKRARELHHARIQDPAYHAKLSAGCKAAWQKKSRRDSHAAAQAKPSVRQKRSAGAKAQWADQEMRERMTAGISAALSNPLVQARRLATCAANRARKADPDKPAQHKRRGKLPVFVDPLEAQVFGGGA